MTVIIGEKKEYPMVHGGELAPGHRITYELYIVSDSADLCTAVKIKHCATWPGEKLLSMTAMDVARMGGLDKMAQDWRWMTREEIMKDIASQEEEAES